MIGFLPQRRLILPVLAALIALMALASCAGPRPVDGFDYSCFELCDKSDPNDTDTLKDCTLQCTKSQSDFGSRGINFKGQPLGKRALPPPEEK